MIVSISGVKFSGKDTAAEALIYTYKFKKISFADKLKDICSDVFNIDRERMDNTFFKEKQFENSLLITEKEIEKLLKIALYDGIVFDYDKVFPEMCKNFNGKILTSIRNVLQVIGTDFYRNHIKDDIWLSYVEDTIKNAQNNIVVTDARFKNERVFLKNLGAVLVLITRDSIKDTDSHISENQIGEESEYDVIIKNDSSIQSLRASITLWYTMIKDATQSYKSRIK